MKLIESTLSSVSPIMKIIKDAQNYLADLGIEESGLEQIIHKAFDKLGLQSYFTAGKMEVRAWTIKKNTKAPQAASVIHSDFEKGFIRAEVITYKNFIDLGSEQACKDAGKLYSLQPHYSFRNFLQSF